MTRVEESALEGYGLGVEAFRLRREESPGLRDCAFGLGLFQDPTFTLNRGYMVPTSRYLGPNRG